MTRIAFVTGPDAGHTMPVLGVARALQARGHETVVAGGTQHEALVLAEGHAFLELPLLRPTARDGDFGHLLWRRAGEMAPPLRDLLAPLGLDLLVVDTLTTVGAFVADMLSLPWVQVVPHHLTEPDEDLPPIGLGLPPATTDARRSSDAAIRLAQAASIAEGHALRDEVRASIGLGPQSRPAARLLQTLPGLEPARRAWPTDTHVVGQLAIDPPLPPVTPPDGDGPLIVVTDSTATGLPAPLGAAALAGLSAADGRLVVTTSRTGLDAWAGAVVGPAPHEPLLDRAAVAVSPGGGGFTAKALTRGVPMVVVPLAGDQMETAGRVQHAGAGVWLPPEQATPDALADAVRRVLEDPSYGAAARRLAETARGLGPDRAADLVEDVLGS